MKCVSQLDSTGKFMNAHLKIFWRVINGGPLIYYFLRAASCFKTHINSNNEYFGKHISA
jgi:hypothetical protein